MYYGFLQFLLLWNYVPLTVLPVVVWMLVQAQSIRQPWRIYRIYLCTLHCRMLLKVRTVYVRMLSLFVCLSDMTMVDAVSLDVDPTPHRAVSLMHVASPHAARKHSGRSKRQAKVSPFDSPKVTGTSAGTSFGPRNTKFFNSSPKKDPFLGPRSPDPANTPVNNAPIRSSLSPNSRNKPEDLQCVPECDSTVGDVIDAIPQTSESSAIQAALHRVAAVESVVSPTPAASVPAPASDSQDKAAPKLALTSLFSKKTSARSLSFMTGTSFIYIT